MTADEARRLAITEQFSATHVGGMLFLIYDAIQETALRGGRSLLVNRVLEKCRPTPAQIHSITNQLHEDGFDVEIVQHRINEPNEWVVKW